MRTNVHVNFCLCSGVFLIFVCQNGGRLGAAIVEIFKTEGESFLLIMGGEFGLVLPDVFWADVPLAFCDGCFVNHF